MPARGSAASARLALRFPFGYSSAWPDFPIHAELASYERSIPDPVRSARAAPSDVQTRPIIAFANVGKVYPVAK